jgi:hypothetical protein
MCGTIPPLPKYIFVAWCLIKLRDNLPYVQFAEPLLNMTLKFTEICIHIGQSKCLQQAVTQHTRNKTLDEIQRMFSPFYVFPKSVITVFLSVTQHTLIKEVNFYGEDFFGVKLTVF